MAQLALKPYPGKSSKTHFSISNLRFVHADKFIVAFIVAAMSSLGITIVWLAYNRLILWEVTLLGLLGGGFLLPVLGTMPILYPRRRQIKCTPADFGIAHWENVQFTSSDGVKLSGWFIPPALGSDGATVVLVHGLSGNRTDMLAQTRMLVKRGYGALLFDLRNHGASHGAMTSLGFWEINDVHGAINYLATRPEVNQNRIGLIGYSMGGATVLRAAAVIPQVRAVIAESAYATLEENLGQSKLVTPFAPLMVWLGEHVTGLRISQVRPIDDVAHIARPILFIHGALDNIVHVTNSVRMYQAASEPKGFYLIDQATHKQPDAVNPVEFEKRITGFLDWSLRDIERRSTPRVRASN